MKRNLKNKHYVVTVIGAFHSKQEAAGGQIVKTKELYNLLCENYGSDKVAYIDTVDWKYKIVTLLIKYAYYSCNSKSIIMLPAHKGLIIFARLLYLSKTILKSQIYYNVIGGWLPSILTNKKGLCKILKKFNGIWVETMSMKKALATKGLLNVSIINNFKVLPQADFNAISRDSESLPLKLCVFSRIIKEKGIEDAVNAVIAINKKFNDAKLTLDIYGPVDPSYKDTFTNLQQIFPSYIVYKGVVAANDSSKVISRYSLLLFPTHYRTEGIPGTIIDAYFAGVPVLAARWNSFHDVVDEGVTGFGYEILNNKDLIRVLEELINNPFVIQACKLQCLKKSEEYTADYAFSQIIASGFNQ